MLFEIFINQCRHFHFTSVLSFRLSSRSSLTFEFWQVYVYCLFTFQAEDSHVVHYSSDLPSAVISCCFYLFYMHWKKKLSKYSSLYQVLLCQKHPSKIVLCTVFLDFIGQLLVVIYTSICIYWEKHSNNCFYTSFGCTRKAFYNLYYKQCSSLLLHSCYLYLILWLNCFKKAFENCSKNSYFSKELHWKVTKNITSDRLHFQAKRSFLDVLPLSFDCTYLQCSTSVAPP